MNVFQSAYDCLRRSVESFQAFEAADAPSTRDALIRDAYEELYAAVTRGCTAYEQSLPYGETLAGGFSDVCSCVESEFGTYAHTRFYLDGGYPGSDAPGAGGDEAIKEGYLAWLSKAKAFLADALSNAQIMAHAGYAPSGLPAQGGADNGIYGL